MGITMRKIVIVEKYKSAYALHNGLLITTPIGKHNQIYYSSDSHQGGNIFDDWYEVDRELFDDEYDYDAIINELTEESEV